MDLERILKEYLDVGVDDDEIRQIALASLAERIRSLKLQIAQAINEARACLLLDNLSGSNQALKGAASLKAQYHHFYAEWRRLGGDTPPQGGLPAHPPHPSRKDEGAPPPIDGGEDRLGEDGLTKDTLPGAFHEVREHA